MIERCPGDDVNYHENTIDLLVKLFGPRWDDLGSQEEIQDRYMPVLMALRSAAGLRCDDCKMVYGKEIMPISLNLPRKQWLMIKPDDGLLCANCIIRRASAMPNVICVNAQIIFSDDLKDGPVIGVRMPDEAKAKVT